MRFSEKTQALLKFDREHLWHPYTSMLEPLAVYPVKAAYGCLLILDTEDEDQNEIIDGMSSWWCAIHGYNNEELNEALILQVGRMSHVMFGGLTHSPAVTLVQKLLKMINHERLQHCFLADSGSVAVEVAMKMALQYHITLGKPRKKKFLTISSGYHGDTTGAMSVCDPIGSMHSIYRDYLPEHIFANGPSLISVLPTSGVFQKYGTLFKESVRWKEEDINDIREKTELHRHDLCAVILEPVLQGAGGMRLYHPQFLIEVRKLCNKYQIPLILDEIATGFGRTGATFAFQHCRAYQDQSGVPREVQVDVHPDIICVGKALTGGYLTLSAVVTTSEIAYGISAPNSPTGGCMMHGPTFMGNPLACAVANRSLDILMRGYWKQQVDRIEEQLFLELLVPLKEKSKTRELWLVNDVRIVGAVGVVELSIPVDQAWFQKAFILKSVHIRPFRNLCYIMPPYIISREQLRILISALTSTLQEWQDTRSMV